jgi:hypothetical protein
VGLFCRPPVAALSLSWAFIAGKLGSWVRIPLKAWLFLFVFLCWAVLCRTTSCDGLIIRPRNHTSCKYSLTNFPYVRRRRFFMACIVMNEWMNESLALQPWRAQATINAVPQPKLVRMRSRWLACSPNTRIRIVLVQQPEPSGSEAGESRVRNRGREIWPTKNVTHALYSHGVSV